MKPNRIRKAANVKVIAVGLLLQMLTGFLPCQAATPEFRRHYELGEDFLERDQYKLAIPEFDEAIKAEGGKGKDAAAALVQRGTAYSALASYDRALKDLSQAVKMDPASDLGYNNRGAVYLRTQKPEAALADFDRAMQINPKNKYAAVNRAGVFLLMTDPGKRAAATLRWLDAGGWQTDFAGRAAILSSLAYLASGDRKNFDALVALSLKKLDRLKWPYSVLKHFQGKADAEAVLEQAQDSTYNLTQAQCFLALEDYFKGKKDGISARLDFVDKHGTINSVEYWLGKAFLTKLRSPGKPLANK